MSRFVNGLNNCVRSLPSPQKKCSPHPSSVLTNPGAPAVPGTCLTKEIAPEARDPEDDRLGDPSFGSAVPARDQQTSKEERDRR